MLVFNTMLTMLLMLIVGVAASRFGLVDGETNRRLSNFAVTVPQSAIILSSAMEMELDMTLGQVCGIIAVGCAMYAILVALGLLLPRAVRIRRDRGVYSFLIIFSNSSFMGFPLVKSLFGPDAVFYAALLCIPFNLLVFSLGVRLIAGDQAGFDWREMISLPMVMSVVSVVLIFLPIRWPGPVRDATAYMGDMITPLSMVVLGASLGSQKLKDVFLDWRPYAFAPVRLLLAPILVWAVLHPFIHDSLLLGVTVVISATPCAVLTTMLSIRYGKDGVTASRTVFVTTVLSVLTIPLVCWLLLI